MEGYKNGSICNICRYVKVNIYVCLCKQKIRSFVFVNLDMIGEIKENIEVINFSEQFNEKY